jgi:hypothetical protein
MTICSADTTCRRHLPIPSHNPPVTSKAYRSITGLAGLPRARLAHRGTRHWARARVARPGKRHAAMGIATNKNAARGGVIGVPQGTATEPLAVSCVGEEARSADQPTILKQIQDSASCLWEQGAAGRRFGANE